MVMKNKTILLIAGVAGAAVSAWGDIGLMRNPDDQWRFIWDCGDAVVPDLVSRGFNGIINGNPSGWNIVADKAPADFDARIKKFRERLDRYQANDVGFILRFTYGWDAESMKAYGRIDKKGEKIPGKEVIDATNPKYLAAVRRAVEAQTKAVGDHPALVGTLTESETRGFVQPTFTPEMRAAWRAHAGCDVPEETNGRNPIPWQKLKDFPKDRIVPDDYPLLEFYRWQWRAGDGWTGYLDMVADTFAKNCAKPVVSLYDPTLRTLSQWGNIGGKVSHLNHWTYVYPEPYRIGYNIAELQAAARGNPGQKVLAMIQAISKRSVIAPKTEHPAGEPAWAKEMPECGYPTTPPDMVQEAMWHVFARQTDGIGFHGWNALYDDGQRATTKGYGLGNGETINRIGKLFAEVGVPLGPLFRALPERAPKVAVVESCAAQVLSGSISYGVHNYFSDTIFIADAANLSPYVLYEDEIKAWGIPAGVETLILPKCSVLTRTSYERIAAFQKRGGRLVADDQLLPALKADATYVSVQEEARNMKGDFDDGIVRKAQDAEVRDRSMWSAAAKLKAAVGGRLYVDCTAPEVLVRARSYGTADYVFAINSKRTLGPYVGAWRRVLEKGLPNKGTVTVARKAGAVYDLVKHAAVPFRVEGGETRIDVAYETNDGRCFLVTERPLSGLKYELDGGKLTVTSSDKDVMIPIRVDGFGKPFYAVVKDGAWFRDFGAAPDAAFGVSSLADGAKASERCWWWPF